MSDPVRIGNFFSSFDTEAVIRQMTIARQGVIRRLELQEATAAAKRTSLSTIQARVAALLGRLNALVATTSVSGKTASVTGTGVSAAATPASQVGSFTVDVTRLATATTATGVAITSAIDASAPLASANFGTTPTNGRFTIATATGGTATISIGAQAANTAVPLAAANTATPITSGTFALQTANGGQAVVNVDAATMSLQDVVDAINATGIGVTASLTNDANGRANILTLTSSQGAISFGEVDTSNFVTAMNLRSSTGTTTRASTAAFTRQMSLNDVLAEINASGIGVTASIVNDANGRANLLSLTSTQGAIALGNVNDTSNFLTAANILASPAGTTRTSTVGMARMPLNKKLAESPFHAGTVASGDQSFTINGTTIAYNVATDTLGEVLNRINASTAGVTARYDPVADTIRLTQSKTGSLAITLADNGAGNLLGRLGLLSATHTPGANAEYSIDGGPTQFAPGNTVTAANGVTLTFSALTTPGSPATVTVTRDATAALNAVKGFITDFNATMSAIDAAMKADPERPGALSGDASLRALKATLRGLISQPGVNITGNFRSLADIGISFGAPGQAVGTANTLQLDEARFQERLAADPASVQNLLSTFTLTPTLTPGGTGSIAGISGTFAGSQAGIYTITDDGQGNLTAAFKPANGGPQTTTSATVTANGTNTSLIPGMTLAIGPVLQQGTHTIVVSQSALSPLRRLKDFADTLAGAGGVLQKRQDSYSAVIDDLQERKELLAARIEREMETWRKRFREMEQAQARYSSIAASLQQMQAQLAANKQQ